MAQPGDHHHAFRPHDRQQGIAAPGTTTAVSCKRKASAYHPEAPPAARRQDDDTLARLAGQIERAGATAAKPSDDVVDASKNNNNNNSGQQQPPRAARRFSETEDSLLHADRPACKNEGGSSALPIVIDDDDDDTDDGPPCPEPEPAAPDNDGLSCQLPEPEPAAPDNDGGLSCSEPEPAATWYGDDTLVSPFGYTTWDPTDGGRYELLSTYVPPPCMDADEEDAQRWLAAVYTAPDLYTSPTDVFWGTPDGVWTL